MNSFTIKSLKVFIVTRMSYWIRVIVLLLGLSTTHVNEHSSLKYCPVTAFRELFQLDTEMSERFRNGFNGILRFHDKVLSRRLYHLTLSGSLAEGCASSRLFFPFNDSNSKILPSIEMDVEMTILTLKSTHKHCSKDKKNKPGFVELKVLGMACFCPSCLSQDLFGNEMVYDKYVEKEAKEVSNDNGYLQSQKIKGHYFEKNPVHPIENDHLLNIKAIAALVLNVPFRSISLSDCFEELGKATNSIGCDIYNDNIVKLKFSIDISFNIKTEWATDVLHKWIQRKKKWPLIDSSLKEEILNHSYIITKPSSEEKDNKNTTELRHSFSHSEKKLISMQSSTQRLIYFIFKSIFYKWIVPINTERISSFMVKTIMLWTCEEFPPEDILWENTHVSILKAVSRLFERLLHACEERILPYYFVPEINVIKNIPVHTLNTTILMIQKIVLNVEEHLPTNIEPAKQFVEETLQTLHRIMTIAKYAESQVSILFGWRWRSILSFVVSAKSALPF